MKWKNKYTGKTVPLITTRVEPQSFVFGIKKTILTATISLIMSGTLISIEQSMALTQANNQSNSAETHTATLPDNFSPAINGFITYRGHEHTGLTPHYYTDLPGATMYLLDDRLSFVQDIREGDSRSGHRTDFVFEDASPDAMVKAENAGNERVRFYKGGGQRPCTILKCDV